MTVSEHPTSVAPEVRRAWEADDHGRWWWSPEPADVAVIPTPRGVDVESAPDGLEVSQW